LEVSQKVCDLKAITASTRHLMPETYGTRDSENYTQKSTPCKNNPNYLCGWEFWIFVTKNREARFYF